MAYFIPILTNVLQGRRPLVRGKFHMTLGRGMVVNCITLAWLAFAIVFFSFPYYQPVTAENMNYTCVCVGGIAMIALIWWFIAGTEFTVAMKKAQEEHVAREVAEAVLRGEIVSEKVA